MRKEDIVLLLYNLAFLLIKKNYKVKFSTNLILKKKIIFEEKKTHEKKCYSN